MVPRNELDRFGEVCKAPLEETEALGSGTAEGKFPKMARVAERVMVRNPELQVGDNYSHLLDGRDLGRNRSICAGAERMVVSWACEMVGRGAARLPGEDLLSCSF